MTGAASHRNAPGAVVRRPLSARVAAICSFAAHVAVIVAVTLITRLTAPPALPPAYAVELVAAPPGLRALGSVQQGPTLPEKPEPEPPARAPAKSAPDPGPTLAAKKPVPAKPAAKPAAARPAPAKPVSPRSGGATAVPGKTPAGGGPTGGRGRDVASVKVQGIAFPYPGYLENITRQIALNFKPRGGSGLRADVTFLIHRDGSVSDLRLLSRSGAYAFDLECMGAVEAVGQRRSFGPLPAGFSDDVLPVVFSFDPSVLR